MALFLYIILICRKAKRKEVTYMYYNDMCTVIIEGNITADLEVKVGEQSGNEYIMFNVANNQGPKDKKETTYYQCWIFGSEACAKVVKAGFKKGSRVRIVGSMVITKFQKDDPQKTVITTPKVTVYDCTYAPFGSKSANSEQDTAGTENKAPEGEAASGSSIPDDLGEIPDSIPDTLSLDGEELPL